MKRTTIGVLCAVVAMAALCCLIIACVALFSGSEDEPISSNIGESDQAKPSASTVFQSDNTTISFEEWTEKYFSSSKEAERTTTSITSEKKQNTTKASTTQNIIFNNNTTNNDTTKFSTTTSTARKTTRTATKQEKDMLYSLAYNQVMKEYYDFQLLMNKQRSAIIDIEAEIDTLKKQASSYYTEYQKESEILKERFADMGLLYSGAYKKAQDNLKNQYENNVKPISEQIDKLEESLKENKELYAEMSEDLPSEVELQAMINARYKVAVEEFQQKTAF